MGLPSKMFSFSPAALSFHPPLVKRHTSYFKPQFAKNDYWELSVLLEDGFFFFFLLCEMTWFSALDLCSSGVSPGILS